MHADYAEIKASVEAAGFFTTFQPVRRPGDRLVCASNRYSAGPRQGALGGNSFWVAQRGGGWFIGTWYPLIYRVSQPERLAESCNALLRREPARAYFELDREVKAHFELVEIAEREFED